ncbi:MULTISPECIES: hypothetical protein [unclassified Paenibacillus]|nr:MULTISPECIES: hypothetical protein [unclassified Paenibacillus]MDF9842170.1 hypothetical protein [Paenibacillus sp. PastF-2]MDF9855146.1 hypothetical protein [Paenibacillus sp. PastF-1]MDH6480415.1 hypothetical protein [Paenibacillus sp. PastH-2]
MSCSENGADGDEIANVQVQLLSLTGLRLSGGAAALPAFPFQKSRSAAII